MSFQFYLNSLLMQIFKSVSKLILKLVSFKSARRSCLHFSEPADLLVFPLSWTADVSTVCPMSAGISSSIPPDLSESLARALAALARVSEHLKHSHLEAVLWLTVNQSGDAKEEDMEFAQWALDKTSTSYLDDLMERLQFWTTFSEVELQTFTDTQ